MCPPWAWSEMMRYQEKPTGAHSPPASASHCQHLASGPLCCVKGPLVPLELNPLTCLTGTLGHACPLWWRWGLRAEINWCDGETALSKCWALSGAFTVHYQLHCYLGERRGRQVRDINDKNKKKLENCLFSNWVLLLLLMPGIELSCKLKLIPGPGKRKRLHINVNKSQHIL